MITGANIIIYSSSADEDRAFLRDKLNFPATDAGDGFLIFALPPAQATVHPTQASVDPDGSTSRGAQPEEVVELYLQCDDVNAMVTELRAQGVETSGEINDVGWGLLTSIKLPSGGKVGMYEPRHPAPPR